ncbi:four-carbon acid sugar kinase family protein [Clavibacter phaseoli]|uniref:four-carbon acid sugar kinase family protein n=5 Tax=Clavibacter phaseoli TaxID=1734031 RepID=UPI001F2F4051|nr:four-carbon acid sugar kinase family protein [Clavibacter phaseoli]UKF30272.1 four-carbon acid sugar kinase family protein [Clavibacter phaseoli]UKF36190.1 four-carbon acid sugar kinase family protein [Clavibacter phaseoli]
MTPASPALADPAAPARVPVGSVVLVADDLTGGADSAVQFARAGWAARLALGATVARHGDDGSVVAIVTDARAATPDEARGSTRAAVARAVADGDDRLFLKIDSTMRGTVQEQVEGALAAWSAREPDAVAVVCPAYPAMGRTVEGGLLLVDGAGVETTSVGRDPVTPVTTSALADLLPGSAHVDAAADAADLAVRIATASAGGVRVVTIDAVTTADLRFVAEALALLGSRAVPVGSAGLAAEMARVWGPGLVPASAITTGRHAPAAADPDAEPDRPRHVVVVVSSLHDVSRAQHADLVHAADTGSLGEDVRTIAPSLDDLVGRGADEILADAQGDGPAPAVTIVLAPERAAVPSSDAPGSPTTAERVATGLALLAEGVIARREASALVLMGGEGARAVLSRQGADAIRVRDAIREGIPVGVIEGGRLHGLPVVTKAGGFGSPSALTDIVPELLDQTASTPTQGEAP